MMVQQIEGRIEILSSFTPEVKILTMQNTYVIFQLDVTEEHAKFCLLTSLFLLLFVSIDIYWVPGQSQPLI